MSSKVSFIIQFKNKFGRTADALNRQFGKIERSAKRADMRMQKFEKRVILRALASNNWAMGVTADALSIHRNTLEKKMKRLGIRRPR